MQIKPRRRRSRIALVLVPALVGLFAAVGSGYAAGANLLPNGDFETSGGSLSGWNAVVARLSLASDGYLGGHAALATAKAKQKTYGLTTSSPPVTGAPAQEIYALNGVVRADYPGKTVCLVLRELTPGGSVVQTQQMCAASQATWTALPEVTLTVSSRGDSISATVQQVNGAAGQSFEADSLTLADKTTTTTDNPPSMPGSFTANAGSSTQVALSWTTSTDSDATGLDGYTIERDNVVIATVPASATTYSDTSVKPASTYSYTITAFDTAQNTSAPAGPKSVTTPPATTTTGGTDDVWHMDETSGTTMVDSGQTPHPGAIHNVAFGQSGDPAFPGTSYGFNGTSSYVDVGNADDLNAGTKDVHIALSLNTTTVPPQPDYDLFRKGQYPGTEYKLELQPNGQFSCEFRTLQADGSTVRGYTIQQGPDLHDGKWHRITCSKVGGTMTVTIDGTAYTKSITGSISNTYHVIIGAYSPTGGGDYYQGLLDEVSFHIG